MITKRDLNLNVHVTVSTTCNTHSLFFKRHPFLYSDQIIFCIVHFIPYRILCTLKSRLLSWKVGFLTRLGCSWISPKGLPQNSLQQSANYLFWQSFFYHFELLRNMRFFQNWRTYIFSLDNVTWFRNSSPLSFCYILLHFSFKSGFQFPLQHRSASCTLCVTKI